ncbi:MAG: helix-turn-helix domain-containing protein [Alphaproteobacteria bacterium]
MAKRHNWRAVKTHRSYTVDEIARLLSISKGTVRRWLKSDLPSLTDQRPALVLGKDLAAFLQAKVKPKSHCALNEAYCFGCKAPRVFAGGFVDFKPDKPKTGNLVALCGDCDTIMNKRLAYRQLGPLAQLADVSIVGGEAHLMERAQASLNEQLER